MTERTETNWGGIMALGMMFALAMAGFFIVAVIRDSGMLDIPAARDARQEELHNIRLQQEQFEIEALATRTAMQTSQMLNEAARQEEAARLRAESWRQFGSYFEGVADGVRQMWGLFGMLMLGLLIWHRRRPIITATSAQIAVERLGDVTARLGDSWAYGRANQLPETLTYAPHISPRYQSHNEGGALQNQLAPIGALDDFLDVGDGSPTIMLGVDAEGNQVKAPMSTWVGIGMYGQSGFGKTTTLRSIATQFVQQGGALVVFDPHHHARRDTLHRVLEPFQSRYALPPALDKETIMSNCSLIMDELQARMEGGGSPSHILVLIDEYTALCRRGDVAGKAVQNMAEALAQEGRKVGMAVVTASQVATAKASGGSEARDSMPTTICHHMPSRQANLVLPADVAKECESLARGEVMASLPTGDYVRLRVPNTDRRVVDSVARNLLPKLPPISVSHSAETPINERDETAETERNDAETKRKRAEIERLVSEGETQTGIIERVWNVTRGGGSAYRKARQEYKQIVGE